VIRLERVTRRFGDFYLDGVDLDVPQGQYWVLLGPSGAGKTLLLHLIAGLHRPDAGRLLLAGEDAGAAPPEARGVGLVFQRSALFPHYDVTGNITYGLAVRGLDAAERRRRLDELVETLDLTALLDRPVASLSGGEAQRVALARALALRPRVLLLDEPLGPLDFDARRGLQEELRRVHQAFELTTLHVTHDREEARALADAAAVMVGGQIIQAGSLTALRDKPRCRFVARLLGEEERAPQDHPPSEQAGLNAGGSCDAL
jgi:ABC-type sulfate/molybdate transport systems ATPase subunit